MALLSLITKESVVKHQRGKKMKYEFEVEDPEWVEKLSKRFRNEEEYINYCKNTCPTYSEMMTMLLFHRYCRFDKYFKQINNCWKYEKLNGDDSKKNKHVYLIKQHDANRLIKYTNELIVYFWIYDLYFHLTEDESNSKATWKN